MGQRELREKRKHAGLDLIPDPGEHCSLLVVVTDGTTVFLVHNCIVLNFVTK